MTKKTGSILFIVFFCIVIASIPLLTITKKEVTVYSIFENRNLAELPAFSLSSVLEGTYFPAMDTYFKDHIYGRTKLLTGHVYFEKYVLKKPVVNTIYETENHILLPYFRDAKTSDIAENTKEAGRRLENLNALIKSYGGTFIYVGIPEQYSVFRDQYPDYLKNNDAWLTSIESSFFNELTKRDISYVNMSPYFRNADDRLQFYLKTDHHYSLTGAYQTYKHTMEKLSELTARELFILDSSDFDYVTLENDFYGSRNRRLYNLSDFEKIDIYTLHEPIHFTRSDNGIMSDPRLFYPGENPKEPVTYNIYMNGDKAETIIKTNRTSLPDALIFGDSFSNALETFLYTSFDELRSLDLRHYDEMSLPEYILEYKPDFVVCVRDDNSYLLMDGNGDI